MSVGEKKVQPIVIKRIKKRAHGHHGGAWKIAYADFVTAMMAFFLLMWLLGSTTKGDLMGIADYFRTPLHVALSGGSGSGDSSSVIRGGGEELTRSYGQVRRGDIEQAKKIVSLQAMQADHSRIALEQAQFVRQRVEYAIASDAQLAEFRSQVRMDMTQDGLRIQIVDERSRPMFDSGAAAVKPYMRDLLRAIGRVLNDFDAKVTLTGHTDAAPFASGERGYSNWELSADRANASRRELVAGGMSEAKVLRVVGLAAAIPLDPADPLNPVNRRISIVVMNKQAERRVLSGSERPAGSAEQLHDALTNGPAMDARPVSPDTTTPQ
ncbi:MAG TPA: flagellar motor protein MotB [Burkholderiaceae bacterium]|nr:flagellar motor protein MotB [Burkholderiaceae bacterium]